MDTKNTENISEIYSILSESYDIFEKQTDNPWAANGLSSNPFRNLVSICLSTMTVTNRVIKACVPLFAKVSTFEELLELDDDELREIIRPVAHYNLKTKYLKTMAQQILTKFNGEIPNNEKDLLSLEGVGPKVANMMMNFIYDKPTIAVDTHILRLLNKLDFVNTSSAEKATEIINKITPDEYKKHAHEWLIQHGMKICHARKPICNECVISNYCNYNKTNIIV